MKTTITQEDYDKAIKARESGKDLTQCCLLYQAGTRNGLKIKAIGFIGVFLQDETVYFLGSKERDITRSPQSNWPSFIGTEVELPEPKQRKVKQSINQKEKNK